MSLQRPVGLPTQDKPLLPRDTNSRPSCSQSIQNGMVVGTRTMISLLPSRSTATTSCMPQLENQGGPRANAATRQTRDQSTGFALQELWETAQSLSSCSS